VNLGTGDDAIKSNPESFGLCLSVTKCYSIFKPSAPLSVEKIIMGHKGYSPTGIQFSAPFWGLMFEPENCTKL
jgi:hypothetical protein